MLFEKGESTVYRPLHFIAMDVRSHALPYTDWYDVGDGR